LDLALALFFFHVHGQALQKRFHEGLRGLPSVRRRPAVVVAPLLPLRVGGAFVERQRLGSSPNKKERKGEVCVSYEKGLHARERTSE
jgi:hypothetical protein